MDVQFVMKRKRKRPACSQDLLHIQGALDLPCSDTSRDIREPSLIPLITILTPPGTATIVEHAAVTVEDFIRKVTAKVPGPDRKQKLLTRKLKNSSIPSSSGAYMQPATRPAPARVYTCPQTRGVSKPAVRDNKLLSLKQRLARAAILSHVQTDEILFSPGFNISSSRRPLDFVSFGKFATPPSKKRSAASSPVESSSEVQSSAVPLRNNWHLRLNRMPRKPGSTRPGYPPLTFIPLREAEAAYAAKFPRSR